jgi:S1-C subfamily serine protease
MRRFNITAWMVIGALALCVVIVPPVQAQQRSEKDLAQFELGITVKATSATADHGGLLVQRVDSGTPAEQAGLRKGDIITQVGSREIQGRQSLINVLARHRAGDRLMFHIMRNGQEKTLPIQLGEGTARSTDRDADNTDNGGQARRSFYSGQQGQQSQQAQQGQQGQRASLGIQVGAPASDHEGVLVQKVFPGSAAASAGLKRGDEIQRVGNRQVEDYSELINTLARFHAGERVPIQVLRDGKQVTLNVKLRDGQNLGGGQNEQSTRSQQEPPYLGVLTAPVQELGQKMRNRLGIKSNQGLVVVEVVPDSPAARAGLHHGDVLVSVEGQKVNDARQLCQVLEKAGVGEEVNMEVMRGNEKKEIEAQLEPAPTGFIMLIQTQQTSPGTDQQQRKARPQSQSEIND